MLETLPIKVHGHLKIEDDLGNVLVDKDNAVHPQNMARVIARALANESNYFVKRIAFGNGGTTVNAALDVTFNPANDGQSPDTRTWDSQLYNETYSEIVDDSDPTIGSGPGSAPGDPATVEHLSGPGTTSSELGILSQVTIRAFLNEDEPIGQIASSIDPENQNLDGTFTFDEIGLFTDGAPLVATAGYQDIQVGTPATTNSESSTTLATGTYDFVITVNGGTPATVQVQVPVTNPTYGQLCDGINTGSWLTGPVTSLPSGATVSITDTSGDFSTIIGAQTFGFLRFTSGTAGAASAVDIQVGPSNDIFAALNSGVTTILPAVDGSDAGVQNNPTAPETEAERLLTHVIFSPVQKTADRTLSITYTLTIAVARSQ